MQSVNVILLILSQRQKTYLQIYAPSKESDQLAQSGSLIRIFTGHILIAKDAMFLHADNEDADQTTRMHRLIWFFDGRACYMVRFVTLHLNLRLAFFELNNYLLVSLVCIRNQRCAYLRNNEKNEPYDKSAQRDSLRIWSFAGCTCSKVHFLTLSLICI